MPNPTAVSPKRIELVNREVYYANNGTEIINTYYIEPIECHGVILSALLGSLKVQDGKFVRVNPAYDFALPSCFCYQANIIPLDPEQFSFAETIWSDGWETLTPSTIRGAFQQLVDMSKDAPYKIMSEINRNKYSTGILVQAKYKSVMSLCSDTTKERFFDLVDIKKEARERTNVIPSGLRLKAQVPIGPLGTQIGYWPSTSIAPVVKEQYQRIAIKRFLVPQLTASSTEFLNSMINSVNYDDFSFSTISEVDSERTYPAETLRFAGYDMEVCLVPYVVPGSDVLGQLQFYNYTYYFEARTLRQEIVYDEFGEIIGDGAVTDVTWNHMLCYPGLMAEFGGFVIPGTPKKGPGLGWYHVGYLNSNYDLVPAYRKESIRNFERLFKLGFE